MYNFFEQVFGGSPNGVIILDKRNKVEFANQAFCRLLGIPYCDAKNIDIVSHIHPEDLKAQMSMIEELTQDRISSFEFEHRMFREDQSMIWVRNVVYTIKDTHTGNIRFGVMSMNNISERKAFEKSMLTLTGSLAHDLMTPLGQIESFTTLIKEKSHLSEKNSGFLDIITQSALHARSIVMEVLENATLDRENIDNYKQLADINHLVYSYVSSFTLQAREQNLSINYKLYKKPVYLNFSKTHIRRVIANLLNNAFKFTPEQGTITIRSELNVQNYCLIVEDTGIGIPEHLQAELFSPFSKAQRKGLQGERSTGLGMYIVKQIVSLHHGTVQVESTEGKGTKVRIELPLP
jgi:PAS domain S-box